MSEQDRKNRKTKTKQPLTRSQKRRKKRKILLIIEIVILLVLLLLLFVWSKFGMINFDGDIGDIGINKLNESTTEALSGYTNFALFGVDNRQAGEYSTGNSDVIIIVSINNDTKKIRLASVYRDTLLDVSLEGETFRKANYAYNHGGETQALSMLNENLDLNLQKYICVDFKAVTNAIDAVGGVEVDVSEAEYQALIEKPLVQEVAKAAGKKATQIKGPGKQTLNGVQATAYMRIRHGVGDDFGRAKRQREVIGLVLEKAKSASLTQLNDLVDAVFPEIYTNFSSAELITLASAVSKYSLDQSFGFPFDKTGDYVSPAGDVLVPCTLLSNVTELHQKMFDEENYVASNTVTQLDQMIINLTGCTQESAQDYSASEDNIGIDDDTESDTSSEESTETTTDQSTE